MQLPDAWGETDSSVRSWRSCSVCAQLELRAEPIAVRHPEGLVHGFLVLRTVDGHTVADGDLQQVARGGEVTARVTFRFRDGSIHDETAVYTQRQHFRLVRYHLSQKGAAFPRTLDLSIDVATGQVNVTYSDDEGEQKTESERMELPDDLANGMLSTLLEVDAGGDRPAHRQAAARLARVGSAGNGAGLRPGGTDALSRRTHLSDRADEPVVARRAASAVVVVF